MANGDSLDKRPPRAMSMLKASCNGYKMLDAAGKVEDGPWCDLRLMRNSSIDVTGTFVGTVQLRFSNAADKPADSDKGNAYFADIKAPCITPIGFSVRWAKAIVTEFTSGSISVDCHGVT